MPKGTKKVVSKFAQKEAARQKRHQEDVARLATEHIQALRELEKTNTNVEIEKAQNQLLQEEIAGLQNELKTNKLLVKSLQGQSIELQDENAKLKKDVQKLDDLSRQIYKAGEQEMRRAEVAEAAGRDIFMQGAKHYLRAEQQAQYNNQLMQGLQSVIAALRFQQARMSDLTSKLIESGQQLGVNPGVLVPVQTFANNLEIQKRFEFSNNPNETNAQLVNILENNHESLKALSDLMSDFQRNIAVRAQEAHQAQQQLRAQQVDIGRLQRQQEEERHSFQVAQAESSQALDVAREEASAAIERERLVSAEALNRAQQESLSQLRAKDAEISRLSEDLANAYQASELSNQRINALSQEVAQRRAAADEASGDLAASLSREMLLNQQQQALESERNQLQSTVNRLQVQIQRQREDLPTALRNMREHDRQIVQRQIDALTDQLRTLQNERMALREDVRRLRSNSEISEGQMNTLQHRLETAQMERDQILARFHSLQDESRRQLQAARYAQQRAEENLNENIQNQDAQRRLAQAENEIRVLQAQLRRQPPPPPARIDLLPPPHFVEIRSRAKRHYGTTRNPVFFETFEPTKLIKKKKTPVKKLFSRFAGF